LSFRALAAVSCLLGVLCINLFQKSIANKESVKAILEKRFPTIQISPAFLHESSPSLYSGAAIFNVGFYNNDSKN